MIHDLPLYQCHKTVRAAKINAIFLNPAPECSEGCQDGVLKLDGAAGNEVKVSAQYLNKHQPVTGGYYVQYDNHYESFSPAEAFEDGYVKVTELPAGFDWAALQRLRKASA